MPEPRVSVLLSVRDGEPYLADALEGLRAQTLEDFEVIAVDDGSRDGSGARLDAVAAEDPRFRVLRHDEPRGLTASLNEAAGRARAPLWARHDADDVSAPERLATQVAAFDADPDLVLLGSDYHRLTPDGRPIDVVAVPHGTTAVRWTLLFHNAFCHSSVMLRAAALEPGRPLYDPALPYAQDYECWSRLLARGRCDNLGRPLVGLRVHPDQLSARRRPEQQDHARRIAAAALHALDPTISLAEVDRLRALHQDPRVAPTLAEWRRMARLLARLGREPGIDRAALRRIGWRLHAAFAARTVARLWRRPPREPAASVLERPER
jgi:glycosyltransferase involved in cell wall biosynthesis